MHPKPKPPRIREQALAYCRKVGEPILIGHLSVHLGWWSNLRDTEDMLEEFVYEGLLRRMTPRECERYGITFAYAWVKNEP